MLPVADVVIVILLLVAAGAGFRAGLFSALGMICGLIAAAAVSPWALPLIARQIPEGGWRSVAVIGSALLLLAVGAAIGSSIGSLLRRGADRMRLRPLERLLGGALGLLAAVTSVSLIGAGVASSGIPGISSAAASSSVLRIIDRFTPDPLVAAMARLHSAVLGDTVLPTVDGLIAENAVTASPDPSEVDTGDPALAAAAESVARVSGIAYGCGTVPTGTGFVAAEDRIVTNAHVVAGIETPLVELPGEPARDGRIVYFDPVDDLAVIAADVEAPALPIADSLAPGSSGAVQGYPYGGPFRTVPAGVLSTGTSEIADIYGGAAAPRAVYRLAAAVQPGNSGGPLLTESGAVAGVVFARDAARADIGYAMTVGELLPVLATLDANAEAVSSGPCIG
ncbi:MarP family serine protease [Leucobacter sp. wl10]|uniref:MarP family serine protease n=1 Tax=Leucobacter sp. wl10 TaxID=2304677 RepID=UPI000E5BBF6A|nr:MarP family serine protease [Leucobacter sp. wl10]RGE23725.1 serine protease [Leucobacter sp. wl10]